MTSKKLKLNTLGQPFTYFFNLPWMDLFTRNVINWLEMNQKRGEKENYFFSFQNFHFQSGENQMTWISHQKKAHSKNFKTQTNQNEEAKFEKLLEKYEEQENIQHCFICDSDMYCFVSGLASNFTNIENLHVYKPRGHRRMGWPHPNSNNIER